MPNFLEDSVDWFRAFEDWKVPSQSDRIGGFVSGLFCFRHTRIGRFSEAERTTIRVAESGWGIGENGHRVPKNGWDVPITIWDSEGGWRNERARELFEPKVREILEMRYEEWMEEQEHRDVAAREEREKHARLRAEEDRRLEEIAKRLEEVNHV